MTQFIVTFLDTFKKVAVFSSNKSLLNGLISDQNEKTNG